MSGGTRITVDIKKLRAAARVIDNQQRIIMSCFTAIRDDVNTLKGRNWEGDSADVYIESMSKLCNDLPAAGTLSAGSIIQTLKEYSTILNDAATAFEKNEQKQEDRVRSLKTELFTV